MRFVHSITISVFSKTTEEKSLIKQTMLAMLPFQDDKIKIKESKAVGFTGSITILELNITKEKQTNDFIDCMKKMLENELTILVSQENRLDDDLFYYIRLDKKAMLKGEWKLTESGECFHIKMSIAAFPKKKEVGQEIVKKMLRAR